jgi:predicted nucleic acid-binding protein
MVAVLFDTNILIDYLNGIPQAKTELDKYPNKSISLITWMEVMVGSTPETETVLRSFLSSFVNLAIDDQVAALAVTLRQQHRIKLPDAIVWATALSHKRILITRNTKDFSPTEPSVKVPYQI